MSLYDRLHVFTSTSGTGAYTVTGTATNRLSIDQALDAAGVTKAGAQLTLWVLPDDSEGSDDFECGIYTYDGTSQLTRTSIIRSSNGNAAVNWGATQRNIVSAPPAALLNRLFNNIELGVLGGTENARTGSPNMPIPALFDGLVVYGTPPAKNTGAMTFSPSPGLPAKAVKLGGEDTQDGDCPTGLRVGFRYDLANDVWHLLQAESITALFNSLRIKRGAINEALGATVAPAATAGWGGGTADIWAAQSASAAFGNLLPLAGPGTIASFGAAPQAGAAREVLVLSSLMLANGANLVVQGGTNFNAVAGDRLRVRAETTTKHHVAIDRANGIITPWVQFTPIFTGFGMPTSVNFFSRRVVDTLEVQGVFNSGSPTATEARVSLGFNGTEGNVTISSTKLTGGPHLAGSVIVGIAGSYSVYALMTPSNGYLTFGFQNASNHALTPANANIIVTNGTPVSIQARIPISNW